MASAIAMTAQDKIKAFAERIQPQLEELGIEAFVLAGYMKDSDGKITRITYGGAPPNEPAYEDGLRVLQALAAKWGMGQL